MIDWTDTKQLKQILALDDFDPDDGLSLVNEAIAEDDCDDPLLVSYQRYEQRT